MSPAPLRGTLFCRVEPVGLQVLKKKSNGLELSIFLLVFLDCTPYIVALIVLPEEKLDRVGGCLSPFNLLLVCHKGTNIVNFPKLSLSLDRPLDF